MLPPLSSARRTLLLLYFLSSPARSLQQRALRLQLRLLVGSSSESNPLELRAPLEVLEEGLRALDRLPLRCFPQGLQSTSLSADSELLQRLIEGARVLLCFRVTLLRLRCSVRELHPLLRL